MHRPHRPLRHHLHPPLVDGETSSAFLTLRLLKLSRFSCAKATVILMPTAPKALSAISVMQTRLSHTVAEEKMIAPRPTIALIPMTILLPLRQLQSPIASLSLLLHQIQPWLQATRLLILQVLLPAVRRRLIHLRCHQRILPLLRLRAPAPLQANIPRQVRQVCLVASLPWSQVTYRAVNHQFQWHPLFQ
jgi:hypothetical protein